MPSQYRHTRFNENLDELIYSGSGPYQIPEIAPEMWVPCDFIGFNYALSCASPAGKGVHFFVDDYQFERVWRQLGKYVDILARFDAVMTPDFSMYLDWPKAIQIYNHYRKHYIGKRLQEMGLRVYPTICWSDEDSFEWCFDGEPDGATVCVSSVGTQANSQSKAAFKRGYDAMCERLHPETIIFYGNVPRDCRGNVVHIKKFTDKWREAKISGW